MPRILFFTMHNSYYKVVSGLLAIVLPVHLVFNVWMATVPFFLGFNEEGGWLFLSGELLLFMMTPCFGMFADKIGVRKNCDISFLMMLFGLLLMLFYREGYEWTLAFPSCILISSGYIIFNGGIYLLAYDYSGKSAHVAVPVLYSATLLVPVFSYLFMPVLYDWMSGVVNESGLGGLWPLFLLSFTMLLMSAAIIHVRNVSVTGIRTQCGSTKHSGVYVVTFIILLVILSFPAVNCFLFEYAGECTDEKSVALSTFLSPLNIISFSLMLYAVGFFLFARNGRKYTTPLVILIILVCLLVFTGVFNVATDSISGYYHLPQTFAIVFTPAIIFYYKCSLKRNCRIIYSKCMTIGVLSFAIACVLMVLSTIAVFSEGVPFLFLLVSALMFIGLSKVLVFTSVTLFLFEYTECRKQFTTAFMWLFMVVFVDVNMPFFETAFDDVCYSVIFASFAFFALLASCVIYHVVRRIEKRI